MRISVSPMVGSLHDPMADLPSFWYNSWSAGQVMSGTVRSVDKINGYLKYKSVSSWGR